jgi:hypothetical protein
MQGCAEETAANGPVLAIPGLTFPLYLASRDLDPFGLDVPRAAVRLYASILQDQHTFGITERKSCYLPAAALFPALWRNSGPPVYMLLSGQPQGRVAGIGAGSGIVAPDPAHPSPGKG